jgi:hypothetical protein
LDAKTAQQLFFSWKRFARFFKRLLI